MALTDDQKAAVRRYLGYPDVNRALHHDLEGAMTAISAEGAAQVAGILTRLDTIEDTLESSWSRQKVVRAEEITLAGDGEIRALRAEGRRLVYQLAAVLDVHPRRDMFGGGPASGPLRRG